MHGVMITRTSHRLAAPAEAVARSHFDHVTVIDQDDASVDDATLAEMSRDLLVSFLSQRIIREPALQQPNVNFHPAPPTYPGRGGASRALYDRVSHYGATCHVMAPKVDAGIILAVEEFPIEPGDSCEAIFARAEDASLSLLSDCVAHFSATGSLPEPCGRQWSGQTFSRRQFEDWLVIQDASNTDEVDRKVRAARHSRFPGPYVMIGEHKFGLVGSTAKR
jgi:methionyl-tRNA formyltransferase